MAATISARSTASDSRDSARVSFSLASPPAFDARSLAPESAATASVRRRALGSRFLGRALGRSAARLRAGLGSAPGSGSGSSPGSGSCPGSCRSPGSGSGLAPGSCSSPGSGSSSGPGPGLTLDSSPGPGSGSDSESTPDSALGCAPDSALGWLGLVSGLGSAFRFVLSVEFRSRLRRRLSLSLRSRFSSPREMAFGPQVCLGCDERRAEKRHDERETRHGREIRAARSHARDAPSSRAPSSSAWSR